MVKSSERAWVRVAREAVGPEGQVVPQQWLAHTTAPGVQPQDRRRLDLVVYGATTRGGALCCDATLVSPVTRTGHPQPCAVQVDGAALQVAERRRQAAYPELTRGGRKHCWCWGPRSAVAGAPGLGASSATRSACGPNARLPPSGAPQRPHGRDDGGAPCRWRCSSRWQALPWAAHRPRQHSRAPMAARLWTPAALKSDRA